MVRSFINFTDYQNSLTKKVLVQHYHPSKALQPIVAYFWTLESDRASEANAIYRLIPDGYVDWIFHLKSPWDFHYQANAGTVRKYRSHLFSHIQTCIEIKLPASDLKLFGVKFHPWAARSTWRMNMGELTDQAVDCADVGDAFFKVLEEKINAQTKVQQMIQVVESFLRKRLYHYQKSDLQVVVQQIFQQPHCSFLPVFSNSQRRLEQRFREEIGISPKMLQRTVRLNQSIQLMLQNPRLRLTDIAYKMGFYDQSHFIQDFRKFTGFSPSSFLKTVNPNGDFFNLRVG